MCWYGALLMEVFVLYRELGSALLGVLVWKEGGFGGLSRKRWVFG